MQDCYVGDIGDYGKYGLLRAVAASGLALAVNWYRVAPKNCPGKRDDGRYVRYLDKPEEYRGYDPALFDCLAGIVKQDRSIRALEASGILKGPFFGEPLARAGRQAWHKTALLKTAGADVVFLDPDNGLETVCMHNRGTATEKHVAWQEIKDYYDRGQSVILYQHRPQRVKKEQCIRKVLAVQNDFLKAEGILLLEYPRYTNRYYFFFFHPARHARLEAAYRTVAQAWKGLCRPVEL